MTADCLKLTSYFGERQRTGDAFVADALLELYGRHEIAASILLRGTEGFGPKHHLRTDRSLTLSADLPLIAVAVDTRPRIEAVLPRTMELNRTGLVTLERARLLAGTAGPGAGARDEATKLTVYLGRRERVYRVPAFVALCDPLHRRGVDGATALLGVDGTAHGQRQRAAFFSRNAEVPMMVIAIGPREQISRVLPELGALLRRPLLTVERVRVCKRDGQCLARPRWRATVQIRARARGLLRILGVESCVAENEEESPWPALQTEFGLAWEDSAVTAMVIRSCVHIEARHTTVPEQLATDLAGTIVRTGALIHETASGALVLSPEPHGRMVQGRRAAGRVRAGRPRMVRAGRGRQGGAVQPDRWRLPADHPDALPISGTAEAVHVLTSSETVLVVVAGAANAEVSAVVETFGPRGGLPPVVRVGGPAPSGPD